MSSRISHTSFDARDAYAQSVFWSQVLDFTEDHIPKRTRPRGMPDHVAGPEPVPALHHRPGRQDGEEPHALGPAASDRIREQETEPSWCSARRNWPTTGGPAAAAGSPSLIPRATSSASCPGSQPAPDRRPDRHVPPRPPGDQRWVTPAGRAARGGLGHRHSPSASSTRCVRRELDAGLLHVGAELLGAGGASDRGGDFGAAQHPGQRESAMDRPA